MTTQQILQGVHDWTNGKIVYDISVAHPDGQGKPTPYADLTAALGTGGANIPEELRKGGMSVKFIKGSAQSSDNKYVQYFLTMRVWSIIPSHWQKINIEDKVNQLTQDMNNFGLCRPQDVSIVKEDNIWRLKINNDKVYFPTYNGSNVGAVDIDLAASKTPGVTHNFIQVKVNSSRQITAESYGQPLASGEKILMVIFVGFEILYSSINYNINGRPFGINIVSDGNPGLMSTDLIVDNLDTNDPLKVLSAKQGKVLMDLELNWELNICLSKPEFITLIRENSRWKLKINNNTVYFPKLNGTNVGAVDIDLLSSKTPGVTHNYIQVKVNSNRQISAESYGQPLASGEKILMVILGGFDIIYSCVSYNVEGRAYGINLATTTKSGLMSATDKIQIGNYKKKSLLCVTSPQFVNITKEEDNKWHLKINAGGVAFPELNAQNTATDINLSDAKTLQSTNYIQVLVNSSGVFSANSFGDTIAYNQYLVMVLLPGFDATYSIIPYNINGRAYSIEGWNIVADYFMYGLCTPNNVRLIKVNNRWRLEISKNTIYFPKYNASNANAVDVDLIDSKTPGVNSNFVQVKVNSSLQISVESYGQPLARNERILMVIFVGFEILYSCVNYSVNGRAFGINLASDVKPGLMSTEDKAKLDSITGEYYHYLTNEPIIPNEFFVLDDVPTTIYRNSMLFNPFIVEAPKFLLTTSVNSRRRAFDVIEPLNLQYDSVGNSARITVEKKEALNINVFKDILIHKTAVASLSGKTPKLLMIGDSLTHGDNGAQSSPIVKMSELLPSRYNITPTMIGTFAPYNVNGEGRGCFNFEAMAGVDNNPFSGIFHFPSVGGTLETATSKTTTKFQNPFTFPATAEDLANHPERCFTNSNNYADEDDGVSYADATAEQKANWHFFIFDFDRYVHIWGDENHKPDVITIALGTNDWWTPGQIDLEKTMLAIDIVYAQIRSALPNVKIGFVTAQNIATTFQTDTQGNWETEICPFLLNLQKKISIWKDNGDNNVYEIAIYACGSRWTSFDASRTGTATDLSEDNNVQKQSINANVHLLDGIGSDGYWQYMDYIATAIACLS